MSVVKKQKKNVPEIRFQEFSGEWNATTLGKGLSIIKGRGLPKSEISQHGKNKCIQYGELYTRYKEVISDVISRTDLKKENCIVSEKGDLLFPSSGETAIDIATFSHLREKDVILSGDLNAIRFDFNVDVSFLAYYLSNFKKRAIARLAQGFSVVHLYGSHLKKIPINLPTVPEQEKISTFLIQTDSLIKNLKTQKEKLEEYKWGMMQKIFSQEVRFKDENGKNFPDWSTKTLEDVFKKRLTRNTNSSIKNVLTNSAVRGIVNQRDYFEKDIANQENLSNYFVVETDDFVYNPRISVFAPVGPFKRNNNGCGVMSPLYTVLTPKKGSLGFYEHYFSTNLWHRYMYKISNFGARHDRMNIRTSDFMKMPIPYPDEEEQAKIADFLTSLDKVIELKGQEIEKVETWKRGLLQKMFV